MRIFDLITPKQLRVKTILKVGVLYLLFMLIGFGMLSEYLKYGYYIDYKHGMRFGGEGAQIAVYGVISVCALGLVYTVYLLVVVIYRNRSKKST
jgi:hypothetical protein